MELHLHREKKLEYLGKKSTKTELSKLKMSGAASTSTEVSVKQQTYEYPIITIKLNNFKRFVNTQEDFRSNFTEIFPVFIESALR